MNSLLCYKPDFIVTSQTKEQIISEVLPKYAYMN